MGGADFIPSGFRYAGGVAARGVPYVLVAFLLVIEPHVALALRPYDGTDADVVESQKYELELGPWGRIREGSKRIRVAPALVLNYGLKEDRELVIEGQREEALDRGPGEPRSSIVDNGIFVKEVLRKGSMQEASGPSLAAEYGVLLPSVHGEKGAGFSVAGIASRRSEAASVHLNAAFAWTREHEADLFLGAILEGPYSWPVRPVAEVFTEQASRSPGIASALVGAIWRVEEGLSFDIGMRRAHSGHEILSELRLGMTWTFR
jgi:hypothetical protein